MPGIGLALGAGRLHLSQQMHCSGMTTDPLPDISRLFIYIYIYIANDGTRLAVPTPRASSLKMPE